MTRGQRLYLIIERIIIRQRATAASSIPVPAVTRRRVRQEPLQQEAEPAVVEVAP